PRLPGLDQIPSLNLIFQILGWQPVP
ncbi:hypothetical protein KKC1_17170, partial [Calderihabitans maritimus]